MGEGLDSNYDKVTIAIGISGLLLFSALGVGLYVLTMDDTVEIDTDWDDDGVLNVEDSCSEGEVGWTSSIDTDYDGDGCNDELEDPDDDNDGFIDILDKFPKYAGFNTDQIPTSSNDKPSDSESIFVGGTAIVLLFTTSLVLSVVFGVKKLMEIKDSQQESLEKTDQSMQVNSVSEEDAIQ